MSCGGAVVVLPAPLPQGSVREPDQLAEAAIRPQRAGWRLRVGLREIKPPSQTH